MVSSSFPRFSRVRDGLWNCRCPYCGDGKKNKYIRRGYFISDGNSIHFYCHNCNISGKSLPVVLKDFAVHLYDEYRMEVFEDSGTGYTRKKTNTYRGKLTGIVSKTQSANFLGLLSINMLPVTHSAHKYIADRQIPAQYYDKLYYTSNFKQMAESFGIEDVDRLPEDERIVIPFIDDNGQCNVLQGRALNPASYQRYITLKKHETDIKCYGLDTVDKEKTVYVFEGPIDSMFIPNSVASADADLSRVSALIPPDSIYVFDYQPRNTNLLNTIERTIKKGLRVCLLPEILGGKDINDLVKSGISPDKIKNMIEKHSYVGHAASLAFGKWRKVNNNKNKRYFNGTNNTPKFSKE